MPKAFWTKGDDGEFARDGLRGLGPKLIAKYIDDLRAWKVRFFIEW